jgi:hypothetical protein
VAVTIRNAFFLDVALCRSCENCFRGICCHNLKGKKNLRVRNSISDMPL